MNAIGYPQFFRQIAKGRSAESLPTTNSWAPVFSLGKDLMTNSSPFRRN